MRCGGVSGRASEKTNLRYEKLVPEAPAKGETSRTTTKHFNAKASKHHPSLLQQIKPGVGPLASNRALRTSRQDYATALGSA